MSELSNIEQLRQAVEEKAGHKMRTPKDFDELRNTIFSEQHVMVSTSTLKRIWGYVRTNSLPRPASLTPLARYIGYTDWEAFADSQMDDSTEPSHPVRRRAHLIAAAIGLIAIAGVLCLLLIPRNNSAETTGAAPQPQPSEQRVLHKGQDCFANIADYLALLNMTPGDTAYFQALPGMEYVYAWGPEYGNPVWHNEGDKQQLMPTITEYWTPAPGEYSDEYVRLANEKLYYERLDHDEVRITFMRNIVDSFYVFLGIYTMDRELSPPQKFVWRRVADSLDTGRLEQLK